MIDFKAVVDKEAVRYIQMIDGLCIDSSNARYSFMDQDEYKESLASDPTEGMRIYWYEILARCHISSVSAIMRTRRWFSAIEDAVMTANLLAFSAAFRGLLESAADSSTSLGSVPLTIAHFHSLIVSALSGRLREVVTCKDLEDELIHYTHARYVASHERKQVPSVHRVRQTKQYMEVLRRGQVVGVDECYRTMCDLTHPGASSVWMWFDWNAEDAIISSTREPAIILDMIGRYGDTLRELLMFGFNPAIVMLQVLNHFPTPEFHTPQLSDWNLSSISLWRKCADKMRNRSK